ncbi:MAG TPA: ABC transporter permease [Candidatus Gracilibacteria bacterium]|nr:ABC transporter permease [Candidatus Gracilibacteria bacterium]
MYFKLAQKNLKTQPQRTVLTTAGIAIAIAALTALTAFNAGLKNAILETVARRGPLTQLTVQPETAGNVMKIFSAGTDSGITADKTAELKKIPHVTAVHPEMVYSNLSSLRVSVLGQTFQTDTMIFGVPYEFIADADPEGKLKKSWEAATTPYPVIISRDILDLYNFTVAPTNRLPAFSEKDVIGQDLTVLPGTSTFFPVLNGTTQTIRGEVAGFSDKADLVGITLPLEVVRDLNKAANPDYKDRYLKIFVEVDSIANVESVQTAVEKMNLSASSAKEEARALEENLRVVSIGLSAISLIILIIAGLTIANTFFSSVRERQHEIGLLRALGATRTDIQKMFLAEAATIGFWGGLIGIIAGIASGIFLDGIVLSSLPDFASKPTTVMAFDLTNLILTLAFATALSIVFAFFPSSKAANLQPLEALNAG